jgi:hypothetical protein
VETRQPPPNTPCRECEFLEECAAYEALDVLVYSKPGFTKPEMTAKFLGKEKAREVLSLLGQCVDTWIKTVRDANLPAELRQVSLPALFDVLISGLYAAVLYDEEARQLRKPGFTHIGADGGWRFFPYVWMCPGCIAEGVSPVDAYLPGATLKDGKMYAVKDRLSRPDGRMIGDFGALCIRSIVSAITQDDEAHFAAGGGHRGEFDLIISTDSLLVLGETKASPLVAFPIASKLKEGENHHEWTGAEEASEWAFFLGAAEEGKRFLPIGPPAGSDWPLTDLRELLRDPENVELILQVWERHLRGYRLFNAEGPETRWHRFGCGNIETGRRGPGTVRQLRVDNTKILPGIDRTDDIKKGIAQVMLFSRLKHGCRARAVMTVLFGNLYAETHHEHYVKPLASLELLWPDAEPVWLFDGIIALSRNILNSGELEQLFDLKSEPYDRDSLTPAEFVEGVEDASD